MPKFTPVVFVKPGDVLGKLTALSDRQEDGKALFKCQCGVQISRKVSEVHHAIKKGHTSSCLKCRNLEIAEIKRNRSCIGEKVDKLTVVSEWRKPGNRRKLVSCVCECGETVECRQYEAMKRNSDAGYVQQCETCRQIPREGLDVANVRDLPEYKVWVCMKSRCQDRKAEYFQRYGGRGITVCEEWLGREQGFRQFYRDMGPRPYPDYTLERKNNDLGYSKDNCIWADRITQANNKSNSVRYEYESEMLTLAQIARKAAVPYKKFYERFRVVRNLEEALRRVRQLHSIAAEP